MTRLLLIVAGLAIGVMVGWLLQRTPLAPTAQSVAAGLLASVVSTLGVALIWVRFAGDDLSIRAVSIDLFGTVIGLIVVGIAVALLHAALGWLSSAVHPAFGTGRPVVLGAASGLVSALVFGVGATLANTLR